MIDLTKCKYDDSISLNLNGRFDDSFNGEYGYRVFYNVPADKELFEKYFDKKYITKYFCGGQIEFTVDKDGNQTDDEVLLWMSEETRDGSVENIEFVSLHQDISPLIQDFKKLHNK